MKVLRIDINCWIYLNKNNIQHTLINSCWYWYLHHGGIQRNEEFRFHGKRAYRHNKTQ